MQINNVSDNSRLKVNIEKIGHGTWTQNELLCGFVIL
jgi:hypothetical protein